MSSPLAIAAVTAALKDLLNDGLLNHDLSVVGSFSVTAVPPDRVVTGQNEPNQLNLFLYQVTPNLGWRNAGLPSRDGNGVRLSSAPLALDLHYLLTAYGSQDLNAEILLGYAMQLLHETPVLTRAQLRTVLADTSPVTGAILPGPFGNLSAIDLADQIELIKLTPVYLSSEDLSKMWTAMQARYRTAMAYQASVVLIETPNAGKAAPPVLKRGKDDRGANAQAAPFPVLNSIRPKLSDLLPAMRLGDDLLIKGSNLGGTTTAQVVFENVKLKFKNTVAPKSVGPSETDPTAIEMTVHLPGLVDDPNAINQWAIGMYTVSLSMTDGAEAVPPTNAVPIALAPSITVSPNEAPAGDLELTIKCSPRLRPGQEANARLIFGSRSIPADSITTPSNPESPDLLEPTTLVFKIPAVAKGTYLVRLRVDGVDSLPITITGSPPKFDFDPNQRVNVVVI